MKALVFDTETTGLTTNRTVALGMQPHVIEFYGCIADLKKGKILHELNTLIRPPEARLITPEITKITTITWEMVKDEKPMAEVMPSIIALINKAKGLPIIAHNLSFDLEVVEVEAQRLNQQITWPARKLCTVEQTIHLKGFRLSLSALHQYLFNEAFEGAHRAKVDVMALLRCCCELVKRDLL